MVQVLKLSVVVFHKIIAAGKPGIAGFRNGRFFQAFVHVLADCPGNSGILLGDVVVILIIRVILLQFSIGDGNGDSGFVFPKLPVKRNLFPQIQVREEASEATEGRNSFPLFLMRREYKFLRITPDIPAWTLYFQVRLGLPGCGREEFRPGLNLWSEDKLYTAVCISRRHRNGGETGAKNSPDPAVSSRTVPEETGRLSVLYRDPESAVLRKGKLCCTVRPVLPEKADRTCCRYTGSGWYSSG